MTRKRKILVVASALVAWLGPARALRADAPASTIEQETLALAAPETQATALLRIRGSADPALARVLRALKDGALYRFQGRFYVLEQSGDLRDLVGQPLRDAAGQAWLPEAGLEPVALDQAQMPLVQEILDAMGLFDPNPETRKAVAVSLSGSGSPDNLALLERALAVEKDGSARTVLEESAQRLKLAHPDARLRREAVTYFRSRRSEAALGTLRSLMETEPDPVVRTEMAATVATLERYLFWRNLVGYVFNGVSLGSILLIMSLGLAITFGLMGIINMAHGEMLMLGSYTAYVVQEVFARHFPAHQDDYFLVALPLSFVLVGLVGLGLERGILRFLHGRPLESLLVTWGIGLVLQQGARLFFGDQTSVNPPTFFRGGFEPLPGLVLPSSRLFIIACSLLSLAGVHTLLYRSRAGLRIRAVMQNRGMAACMGISTRRVDAWTFALGTALAGLAGCALSLIGTVDPEVGKTYIVDSFMVVVLGGVGKLAGTVLASAGIGMASKLLEPAIGGTAAAIYAKVAVLVMVILFLQLRPTGIFAARGRATEVMAR